MSSMWSKTREPEALSSHVVAAMIAGGLSLIAHLVALYVFGDLQVQSIRAAVGVDDDARQASLVERVDRSEPRAADEMSAREALALVDIADELGLISERVGRIASVSDPVLIEPPAVAEDRLDQGLGSAPVSPVLREVEPWLPRREIIAVEHALIDDEMAALPRDIIPLIERVRDTPDYVPPFDLGAMNIVEPAPIAIGDAAAVPVPDVTVADVDPVTLPTHVETDAGDIGGSAGGLFVEPASGVVAHSPIESLLRTEVLAAVAASEPEYTYFRISIDRISEDKLPVLSKDVLLVQDCSRSMDKARLQICQRALDAYVGTLREGDRFDVVSFAENTKRCFGTWAAATAENVVAARGFIRDMSSFGETDIYGAMKALGGCVPDPERPAIILLVTDGRPTVGMTESARIIGDFTKKNRGAVSVFTLGTSTRANWYLLEQLSYSNRGTAASVRGGRWGIPAAFTRMAASVAKPLLSNVELMFDSGSRSEVFPLQTMNLYEGRPLVLYGRCPSGVQEVTLQATGQAADVPCDMVFRLPVTPRLSVDAEALRARWAEQKVYSLMGQQALEPSQERQADLRRTSRDYGVAIPYVEWR